jgi:hypothetical protein
MAGFIMATTTPNYGWPVPTSTDYVKDGATAIEALGDAIDATVFGLKGIAQVVSTVKTDTFTTTSNTYVDVTGLSVTITPTKATSKILVIAQAVVQGAAGADNGMGRLMRNSTPISVGDAAGSRPPSSFGIDERAVGQSQVVPFLDSPATTSATTYKLQIRANSSGFTMCLNRNSNDTDATTTPRYASSITVIEVLV